MITTVVRFSYLHAFVPKKNQSGVLKYSTAVLVPKEDEVGIKDIQNAINAAVEKGIETNKFTAAQVQSSKFKLCLRDGDAEYESGDRGPEYQGHYFFNASSDNKPGVVKAQKDTGPVPIFDPDDFYSGCYGRIDVNFFPYNTAGNRGIGAGLNNLMMVKTGERLDGRMNAEDAFAGFTNENIEKAGEAAEANAAEGPLGGDLE